MGSCISCFYPDHHCSRIKDTHIYSCHDNDPYKYFPQEPTYPPPTYPPPYNPSYRTSYYSSYN